MDVSNRGHPVQVGSLSLTGLARQVRAQEGYLYVPTSTGLSIFDLAAITAEKHEAGTSPYRSRMLGYQMFRKIKRLFGRQTPWIVEKLRFSQWKGFQNKESWTFTLLEITH